MAWIAALRFFDQWIVILSLSPFFSELYYQYLDILYIVSEGSFEVAHSDEMTHVALQ